METSLDASLMSALTSNMVIGIDEVGRGCIAGPVAACAFVFRNPRPEIRYLRDSKKLSPKQRRTLEPVLAAAGWFGYGQASSEEVDRLGLNPANFLAMRRALEALNMKSFTGYQIVVDGNQMPDLGAHDADAVVCIEKADDTIAAVSAASILAKVRRDLFMERAAEEHPGYGFEQHSGYPVAAHLSAIDTLGPCRLHRMSCKPLKTLMLARG
jgi:ribonuclease HII